MDEYFHAALSLRGYLAGRHWDGSTLVGPDPGVRFSYRIGRFLKGTLPRLPWRDDYYYLQAQGYWVLGNWLLFAKTDRADFRTVALDASKEMLGRQRADGAWDYPNFEWRGRIATVEGIWASLGLLESYRQSQLPSLLDGALRWHRFMVEQVGFRTVGDGLAIDYFAGRERFAVTNNSACALRFLAELASITGDRAYLEPCAGMLRFLAAAQRPTGELPYAVEHDGMGPGRPHFQCYQYNAFQFLDLLRYRVLTDDLAADCVIERLLAFLRTGVASDGHAYYSCSNRHTAVTYHAAVLAAALLSAAGFGLSVDTANGRKSLSYVLGLQRGDGSLPHSRGDYRILHDDRSYPRYLAMMVFHLMLADAHTSVASSAYVDAR